MATTDWRQALSDLRNDVPILNNLPGDQDQTNNEQYAIFLSKYRPLWRQVSLLLSQQDQDSFDCDDDLRRALRFASCSITLVDSKTFRRNIQVEMMQTEELLLRLLQFLSLSSSSSSSDTQLQTTVSAARLLCNLVTANERTSKDILLRLSCGNESMYEGDECTDTSLPSWIDLIEATQTNEAAVTAILATLYNALSIVVTAEQSDNQHICLLFAQSSRLIQTLLQQVTRDHNHSDDSDNGNGASEWILLLLERFLSMGLFPQLYMAAANKNETAINGLSPEQVTLLACITSGEQNVELGRTYEESMASILFLVQQYLIIGSESESKEMTVRDSNDFDSCGPLLLILQVLAVRLCNDTPDMARIRTTLGQETQLILASGRQLTQLVDTIVQRNIGKTSKNMNMSPTEQEWVTCLVRLLGNLVYQCEPNQELLRTLSMPPMKTTDTHQDSNHADRNIVHVLLSCTSFAWACLTLREWTIVAIRNALQENLANQTMVAQLEAQQAVQSTALDDMGIRVDLDETGKVTVHPLDERNKEI